MNQRTELSTIQHFLLKAAELAMKRQADIEHQEKDGRELVTEADRDIEYLARDMLKPWLDRGDKLVGEESIKPETPDAVLAAHKRVWVVDPIDGTIMYAHGLPGWGIMIALLVDGWPKYGGIYIPSHNILLLGDGQNSWQVTLDDTQQNRLQARAHVIRPSTPVGAYFADSMKYGRNFAGSPFWVDRPASSAEGCAYTLLNRYAGMVLPRGMSLWDAAAAAALIRNSGHKLLAMAGGRELKRFTSRELQPSWKLAEDWILCHPDNYAEIRHGILHGTPMPEPHFL